MYAGKIPFRNKEWKYNRTTNEGKAIKGKFLVDYGKGDYEEDNAEFEAELFYDGYGRGRSSAVFYFRNEDSTFRAQMFMSDFDNLLQKGINPSRVKGVWCYIKRGANFGMQFVREV